MQQLKLENENEVLDAIVNMKYDLQVMAKSTKVIRGLQKMLIDTCGSNKFTHKNPPKAKDVCKWVKYLADEYVKNRK